MASINISIRTDSELKKEAESILNQLGMTINGAFNMFLTQIVREKAVPLNLSLTPKNDLYAQLLRAELDRNDKSKWVDADEMAELMDSILEKAKRNEL